MRSVCVACGLSFDDPDADMGPEFESDYCSDECLAKADIEATN